MSPAVNQGMLLVASAPMVLLMLWKILLKSKLHRQVLLAASRLHGLGRYRVHCKVSGLVLMKEGNFGMPDL